MVILYSCMRPVLLILTTTLLTAYGFHRDHPVDESELSYELEGGTGPVLKRNAEKSSVWLGPRLGRRKRSEEDFNIITQDKNGGTFIEILQDTPWALVPLKGFLPGSPRRSTTFTPRLGRDSDEEYTDSTMEVVYGKAGPRTGNHATGSFTPRLGRHATLFNHHQL
ncbi:UNVERIFIED_CONTAM: hypothetical protein PYX00_005848 [Menopon gallinae]|uniref:Uncharacterized protein n=1 Tax=Menopon gallinae TaxID=328185 RepID=A0AAW2HTP1_9NEOP